MAKLVPATGPRAGERIEIGSELIIGRSPSCDVALPEDAKVSRRHARLAMREGGCFLSDLGSRNGTFVNGERVGDEVAVYAGDRLQVGDTSFLYDPLLRASVGDGGGSCDAQLRAGAVEEFLPAVGESASLFQMAQSLLACTSEAAALRAGAEEAMRLLGADLAAALLAGGAGLATAAVVGAPEVEVPRALLAAASERREAAYQGGRAIAPLWAGGTAFGALYLERKGEGFVERDLSLLGVVGRLCGEAVSASRARRTALAPPAIVGADRAFRRAVEGARRMAASQSWVVIAGEAGTGKGLFAQYMHMRSPRALAPLVVVDCRSAAGVLEPELFGAAAEGGAPPRLSAFARADGGTLVLRSVEALPRDLSGRLARVLRSREAPLPGGGQAPADFRVFATASDAPARLAAAGRLAPELAQALEGRELSVPPLRERGEDAVLLFAHFSERAARQWSVEPAQLAPDAREALLAYSWPGNVREVRLCAERLALLCGGDEIAALHLPRELALGTAGGARKLDDMVAQLERDAIAQALRRARGKKIRAAEILGISRPTLDKKIALYRLAVK